MVGLLRRRRALKTCVVSSFDHKALRVVRALEPKLRLGYLLGETSLDEAWAEMAGNSHYLSVETEGMDTEALTDAPNSVQFPKVKPVIGVAETMTTELLLNVPSPAADPP